MGVALKDLIQKQDLRINDLKDKILVVDAYNNLYQYITSIRQRDGSLLTDSKGRVTSHLVGLFSRTTKLMKKGIKLAFVFDGEPPEMKRKERERRKEIKIDAQKKYEKAAEQEDIEMMRKYASRTARLTEEMVSEAKELISALGLPVIQAPSEGEAQAAYMVNKGDAYAVISQDYDSFIYGATRVIQNLNLSGKKKSKSSLSYETIKPQMIIIGDVINELGIDQEQLIILSILVGTDYNHGGIKGIGPKTALKLVKQYGKDFDDLFKENKWAENFDFPWTDVFYTIKNMKMTNDYNLQWNPIDEEKLRKLLVEEHEFSELRVEGVINDFKKEKEQMQQKGLGDFF
ncbi:MAG: flap endonuclease-1 [Nanoarchaeota archaeon]|nr:flap endonuclease-1 [Nanoarchaeota archaeon]